MSMLFGRSLLRAVLWAHWRPSIQRATADTESSSERNALRSSYEQVALRGSRRIPNGATGGWELLPLCFPVLMACEYGSEARKVFLC